MTSRGFGIPLICPKCPKHLAPRALKTPQAKHLDCPECRTPMVPVDPVRREAWLRRDEQRRA